MTQEQKDWFEYGRALNVYFALKTLNDPNYREFAKRAWDARRKAYSWNNTSCDNCKFCDLDSHEFPCRHCFGEDGYWEPKD